MNEALIQRCFSYFKDLFMKGGMDADLAIFLGTLINFVSVVLLVWLVDRIARLIIVTAFRVFSDRTSISYDDFLAQSNFPKFVAHFVPMVLLWYLEPFMFKSYPFLSDLLVRLIDIYLVILSVLVVRSLLRSTLNYLRTKDKYKDKPLESYLQVLMIFAWGIGLFFIISILTGYELKSLLTLGAASAAILLIFRDTILGFVASIQVTVNDIVRIGDWITFSKYGADGLVTEINLATVIVQNWDKTFTTIPTYSLTSDSFQNWRGMLESDGRRIKRSVLIKQRSVRFLEKDDIERLKQIERIRNYIGHRQQDIDQHNQRNNIDKSLSINGRNQTNLGVFRKYIDAYLHQNPAVNKNMMIMVRQLQPTEKGIPIEIYCFSRDKEWQNYEYIMGDIMDHVLAAIPYFGLELFELPSGPDLAYVSED
jgi:miniconductance mechanosensitive channel